MQIKTESGKGRIPDSYIIYTMVPHDEPTDNPRPQRDQVSPKKVEDDWFEILKNKLKEKNN